MASGRFLSKSVDFSKFGGIIILNNQDFKGCFSMNYHSTEGTIIMTIPIVISLIFGALMVLLLNSCHLFKLVNKPVSIILRIITVLLGFYGIPVVVIFKIVDAILWRAEVKERKKQNEEK